jgi:hypothetical protein
MMHTSQLTCMSKATQLKSREIRLKRSVVGLREMPRLAKERHAVQLHFEAVLYSGSYCRVCSKRWLALVLTSCL